MLLPSGQCQENHKKSDNRAKVNPRLSQRAARTATASTRLNFGQGFPGATDVPDYCVRNRSIDLEFRVANESWHD